MHLMAMTTSFNQAALILSTFFSTGASASNITIQTFQLPDSGILFRTITFLDGMIYANSSFTEVPLEYSKLIIASCESKSNYGRDCQLIIHKNTSATIEDSKRCPFMLKTDNSTYNIAPYLRIFHLSDGAYLVSWMQFDRNASIQVEHVDNKPLHVGIFEKFIAINSSDCSYYESKTTGTPFKPKRLDYSDVIASSRFHLYEDGFSVFYVYTEEHDLAQEDFNLKGEREYGPVGQNDFLTENGALTVASYSKNIDHKKCFSVMKTQERFRVVHNFDGRNDVPYNVDSTGNSLLGYSTSNINVTYCKKSGVEASSWNCTQGETGETKEFTLEFDYQSDIFMIYNMPGGGLMTLTNRETNQYASIYLTRFGVNGKHFKSVEFVQMECTHSALLGHFYRNRRGKLCLSLLWGLLQLENLVKCYDEETISKRE